jgi:hypothetical protein
MAPLPFSTHFAKQTDLFLALSFSPFCIIADE